MAFSLFPLENFPNEIFAMVFSLLFIFIVLVEIRILARDKGKSYDKNSLYFVLIGIFVPLFAMIILSFFGIGKINPSFGYFGLVILIAGFLLRQYSIYVLGRFFIPVVKKLENHEIVQKGPYKYLRHPSYTGLFLELIGTAFSFANLISIIIVLIFFVPAILYRINIEEKFLLKNFEEYKFYKEKTWKLIPFIF